MRSTTVGWLTSMLRVLPVTADHIRLNTPRPDVCEINHPIAPAHDSPKNNPTTRAAANEAEDRGRLAERKPASGSTCIPQGYHPKFTRLAGTLVTAAAGSSSSGLFWWIENAQKW